MGVLSNELSSWRKHLVECKAGIVNTLNFRDTRPNIMLVMNPSNSKIMCCLDSIPTEKNYDFLIKNHYARLVGRPTPTSQVYFLSDYDVTLQVYSIYDKNFDPSWLSDFSIDNVNLESETLKPILDALKAQSSTKIAGVENGVNLPVTDATAINKIEAIYQALMNSTGGGQLGASAIWNYMHDMAGVDNNGSYYSLKRLYQQIDNLKAGFSFATFYQLLMTLSSGGNKGIADITGSDGTSLKDVKDSIQSLNTILQDCKTLLTDIKTNTTPTTTP